MDNLKIKDLKYIQLLGRFESLRSLSRHVGVEPQNISKRFEQIEESLGLRLFTRSAKGISLTSQGVRAVKMVEDVLRRIHELENVETNNTPYGNYLNFSSRGFIINYICPFLARAFKDSDLGLRFIDQSPEAMERSARENLLDVTFHFGEVELGKDWERSKVGQIPYVFVVKNNHPLGERVQIEELQQYRMVGGCYVENNRFIIPKLSEIGQRSFTRGYDSENSNYSKSIIKETFQFSLLPLTTVINELKEKTLRIIEVDGQKKQKRNVFIEVHQDHVLEKTKKSLISLSKECFKELETFSTT